MEKAKVYFTDFRTAAYGDGLPAKLKKLMRRAGVGTIDMEGKFVAIKMHFGEQHQLSAPELCEGRCGSGEGRRREAVFDGLQHHVSRQPQKCA